MDVLLQQNAELKERAEQLSAAHEGLLEEHGQLRAEREKLAADVASYKQVYLDLLERFRKLEKGLVGQKAERLPPDERQLSLDLLAGLLQQREAQAEDAAPAEETTQTDEADDEVVVVESHTRRRRNGRTSLPEHLPRVEIVVLPLEVEREGLDAFDRIGEESSEVLERRPASVMAVRTVRPKFVRKDRDRAQTTVYIAEPPELPIERGNAGPGMLADSIVRRWQDHLPLHRLEGIYARDGIELARSTMCGWHEQLGELVAPLVDAMWKDAFAAPYLCTDATGVLVQAKEKCSRGHFWVVLAPERHVLFGFSKKHDKRAVDQLFDGYEGFLVADAHTVYDHLFSNRKIVEAGCWAHARRYFFKALATEPELARQALSMIGGLFRLERTLATAPRKKKEQVRRSKALPIVDAFFDWCDEHADKVLDETPIAKAVGYARNQRKALKRFLQDGRLPIHNNGSELALRRQAIGRKNWLFVGSEDGAKTNTLFVSLLASCQMHGIEPWRYLRDLFCLMPSWPASRILELAPAHWKATSDRSEVQRLLEANVYWRATNLPVEDIVRDYRATKAKS